MATRSKTVEFVYDVDTTSLAADTKRTFTGNTLYLPESSKTFRSVTLVATWADDATVASSPTNWILGIKLGAVAESTVTVTDTVANTGEAWSMRYTRDVTAYFVSNWSGASMTWEASVQQAVSATQNHSVKLIITYEYDDTSSAHVKTIRVPIESTRASLTTSYQTIGGATAIPAITGAYLPEASKTVRQVWLELWGNTATAAATDFILTARVNGANAYDFWDEEAALISGRWAYGIVDITAENLSSARSLEGISTGVTTRGGQIGGMVCVTYEFDPAATTTVFNSLLLGGVDVPEQMGGTAAGDEDVWTREIFIDEPGTITLKESGVSLSLGHNGSGMLISVAAGAQTDTSYQMLSGSTVAGQMSFVHRIDAGGTAGTAGITLARGPNTYSLQYRCTNNAGAGWFFSGTLILNYTSDKATAGVGAHAQSRYFHLADTDADAVVRQVTNVRTPTIPEAQYMLVGSMVEVSASIGSTTSGGLALSFERTTGGWQPFYTSQWLTAQERELHIQNGSPRAVWVRWPGDPDPQRDDITVSRDWRCSVNPISYAAWGIWVTWHAHSWTVAGTVTGTAGDGSGLTVNLHRASTGELVKQVTTTAGGGFTTTWGDNVDSLFCDVVEDSTHTGRSANSTAA